MNRRMGFTPSRQRTSMDGDDVDGEGDPGATALGIEPRVVQPRSVIVGAPCSPFPEGYATQRGRSILDRHEQPGGPGTADCRSRAKTVA